MADSNAPEHTDRGLFGMFGKKDEKQDQNVHQQSHTVDAHATHAPSYTSHGDGGNAYGGQTQPHQSHSVDPYTTHTPSYTGHGEGGNAYGGQAQPHQYGQGGGGNAYGGEVHHAPPSAISHQTQHYGQEEGGHKQHEGKLHRSNSSSSSSSDEDEDGGKKERKEGRKKKGMKEKPHGYDGETETQEGREKKGIMDKIKEKLPGSHGVEKY